MADCSAALTAALMLHGKFTMQRIPWNGHTVYAMHAPWCTSRSPGNQNLNCRFSTVFQIFILLRKGIALLFTFFVVEQIDFLIAFGPNRLFNFCDGETTLF